MRRGIPQSAEKFEAVMEEIDGELRRASVPIPARHMRAMVAYSQRFGLDMRMAFRDEKGTPGNYGDDKADAHIREWFTRRYGTRQNVDVAYGNTVLLIRDDVWRLRLPVVFGTVDFVVERDLSKHSETALLGVNRPPTLNVLSQISGLTQGLASQLTDDERMEIIETFAFCLQSMQGIDELRGKPYAAEIGADISTAVAQILARPPHFGQSKWASSQAAEKLLKCLLKINGVSFEKTHQLRGLAVAARTVGALIDDKWIASALAPAGVRYGEVSATLAEALDAHYASLRIGHAVRKAAK